MKKDTVFSVRISSVDLDAIRARAKQARMSQSDYVVRCCLGRPIVIIEALKEFLSELRAIGNNLNRLVVLANMGRITVVNLDGVERGLAEIGAAVSSALKRGK